MAVDADAWASPMLAGYAQSDGDGRIAIYGGHRLRGGTPRVRCTFAGVLAQVPTSG